MRKLETITGKELFETYCFMYEDRIISEKTHIGFSKIYSIWIRELIDRLDSSLSDSLKVDLCLSTTNYVGKKTRALLFLLDIKTPKNKKELIVKLKERI